MELKVFLILATLSMVFNFTIWSRNGWLNVLLKVFFFLMSLYGTLLIAIQFGWLVKGH